MNGNLGNQEVEHDGKRSWAEETEERSLPTQPAPWFCECACAVGRLCSCAEDTCESVLKMAPILD